MFSRNFLSEFIHIYKNEPCLWQVSSKQYHDRNKKKVGYAKLVKKLKEVDPNATRDDAIKKINNIRSAVRKENKKAKHSLKLGASADSVYKPKLWYYSLLSFLSDKDSSRTSRSNVGSDDEIDEGVNEENTSETDVPNIQETDESTPYYGEVSQSIAKTNTYVACSSPRTKLRKRGHNQEDLAKEMLVQVNKCFKKPCIEEDRFDVIAKGFAIKLRSLPQQQMLLAEKLMNDALFEAEMGSLTMSHRVVGEQHTN